MCWPTCQPLKRPVNQALQLALKLALALGLGELLELELSRGKDAKGGKEVFCTGSLQDMDLRWMQGFNLVKARVKADTTHRLQEHHAATPFIFNAQLTLHEKVCTQFG